MKTYQIKAQEVSLNTTYDVIVVGGGPAGITSALSAAREGARTLLVEGTSALGGMSTTGLVTSWCPFTDQEKIIYKGLAEKILMQAKAGIKHVKEKDVNWVAIDPEFTKRLYDTMMEEAGVDVLFNTTLCAAETQGRKVETILLANKAGLMAYQAKVFIDTTGDADLVAFAGGAFMKGDRISGELQSVTHCFILSNVDDYGFENGPWLNRKNPDSPAHKIQASEAFPLVTDAHICAKLLGPGTVGFNAGHVEGIDNTDPLSNSYAYRQGRRIAHQLKEGLKVYFPEAFGNAFLANTATLLGVRETRRIVGDYILTIEDYDARRTFDDEICRNSYFLDIHAAETMSRDRDNEERRVQVKRYGRGESHGIPYRCLIPKSFDNVLAAGRSISVERVVQGSVRVMPVCLAMGEAAGMAAAHALAHTGSVRAIDVKRLRARLLEEGAYIL